MPWTAQGGKEKAFAPEQGRLDLADKLDIILNGLGQRNQAAGIHPQGFAGLKFFFNNSAAGMDKDQAIAVKTLHDKPLPAKQGRADLLLQGHADGNSLGRTKKGVFLTNKPVAEIFQVQGNDFPGVWGTKGDLTFSLAGKGEKGL